jgi:glycosyltransferase involved in cell wall biosynthesis
MTGAITLTGPIAYLSGEYPRATDTFIQREVAGLRALGVEVLTCSVRRTGSAHHVGPEQRAEYAATYQVQQQAKRPLALIGAHLALLARNPKAWLGTIGLAARTCPPGIKALLWQIFYVLEAGVLARYMQTRGVIHLHNHFANSSCSVAMLASRMSGIPFSFTLHGPAIFFEPHHWRIDAKIAEARFVACISHFCRAQAMLFADQADWSKLKIVHCGVEPERYLRNDAAPRGKRLLFIGRLDAIKGVPLLLNALAALRASHPEATLTIVGDGPHRRQLEDRTRALELEHAVTFTGYQGQDAVADLLSEADMLVLPSFAEGVPVVLMEGMAAGLPVIASQVAGVPELVEDGVAGYVIPAGDPATLADRIDRLLSDPALCARMGVAGRARVVESYDARTESAWLAHLFAGSLAGHLPAGLRNGESDR